MDFQVYNYLLVCSILKKFSERFLKDGAADLNIILQNRGQLTKEQAFALIWDMLKSGLIEYVEVDGMKAIRVVDTKFEVLRSAAVNAMPDILSEMESERWNFKGNLRSSLTPEEEKVLHKFIETGRVVDWSVAKTVNEIQRITRVDKANPEEVDEDALRTRMMSDLRDLMHDAIMKFAKLYKDSNFVIEIKKEGSNVTPTVKRIQVRSGELNVNWK